MITELTAATAETPDPDTTTAATAESSQVAENFLQQSDTYRTLGSEQQSASYILQQSVDDYISRQQEHDRIANDPSASREARTEAAAAARSLTRQLYHVRRQQEAESAAF
jgi:hypothetical protein